MKLHATAANGRLEEVKSLIAKGMDVNKLDKDGFTALHRAAYRCHGGVVQALLEAGADTALSGCNGARPLLAASREGWGTVVKLLLAAGADPSARTDETGETPLMAASLFSKDLEIINLLLDADADVNQLDNTSGTALMSAVCGGSTEVVKALLERGADKRVETPNGTTALSLARERGMDAIARILTD